MSKGYSQYTHNKHYPPKQAYQESNIIPWHFKPHWLVLTFTIEEGNEQGLIQSDLQKFLPLDYVRDSNSLTDSFIPASDCAEDLVTKFTSLVRTRDKGSVE